MNHDLKMFGLSHWQDRMKETTGEGKGGSPCPSHAEFRNCTDHHVETLSRESDL